MFFNPEKFRPPHFLLGLIAIATLLQTLLRTPRFIPHPWHWLGLAVMILGCLLMSKAHQSFTKHNTPIPHNEQPRAVVTTGIYQYSRNPMYVAGALIFLGITLWIATWPFFVAWLSMGLILDQCFIPWEEKRMESLFGQEYLEYKKRTRRWI